METPKYIPRHLFDKASTDPYKLSRSKVELFLQCPRCFYLDRRFGIGRIDSPAYTLNLAVDVLLKKEFDAYRKRHETHPLMHDFFIEAVPFDHPDLDRWRDNRQGLQYVDATTLFLVFGAVDDIWVNPNGALSVVDYKATSTEAHVSMDTPLRESYKRQLDIYHWLLKQNGFSVSSFGYFLFANARKDTDAFRSTLTFETSIVPYQVDTTWVSDALEEAKTCLMRDTAPLAHPTCEWCQYRQAATAYETP